MIWYSYISQFFFLNIVTSGFNASLKLFRYQKLYYTIKLGALILSDETHALYTAGFKRLRGYVIVAKEKPIIFMEGLPLSLKEFSLRKKKRMLRRSYS